MAVCIVILPNVHGKPSISLRYIITHVCRVLPTGNIPCRPFDTTYYQVRSMHDTRLAATAVKTAWTQIPPYFEA